APLGRERNGEVQEGGPPGDRRRQRNPRRTRHASLVPHTASAACSRAVMRAIVIVNPIAGPGRRRTLDRCAELARSVLATHGYTAHVVVTESPTDASRFGRDALQLD